jgi:hypothetical protein
MNPTRGNQFAGIPFHIGNNTGVSRFTILYTQPLNFEVIVDARWGKDGVRLKIEAQVTFLIAGDGNAHNRCVKIFGVC